MFSTEIESCFSGSRTSIIVIDGKSKHGQFVYLLFVSIQVFWTSNEHRPSDLAYTRHGVREKFL